VHAISDAQRADRLEVIAQLPLVDYPSSRPVRRAFNALSAHCSTRSPHRTPSLSSIACACMGKSTPGSRPTVGQIEIPASAICAARSGGVRIPDLVIHEQCSIPSTWARRIIRPLRARERAL
jgi:hypothetical protein